MKENTMLYFLSNCTPVQKTTKHAKGQGWFWILMAVLGLNVLIPLLFWIFGS